MNKPEVYIFLGPPGAGKGTQAILLASERKLMHLSTGEILRSAVESGSELGKEVSAVLASGNLVSDVLVNKLIEERLKKAFSENKGIVFDGYPRNLDQARELKSMLARIGYIITAVLDVDVPQNILFDRIKVRGQQSGRSDDSVEVLSNRLQVYLKDTAPLTDFYQKEGFLKTINGLGTVDEVSERIKNAVFA